MRHRPLLGSLVVLGAALLLGIQTRTEEGGRPGALRAQGTPAGEPIPSAADRAPLQVGGIDVGETNIERLAEAMRADGLNTLQISYYAHQGDWDGAELSWREPADKVGALRAKVRAAKAAGLQVMLVLRVQLDSARPRNRHLWHGLIWPTDDALPGFFAAYREYVLWAADLAQQEGVETLLIGNELNALTGTGVDIPGVLARALSPTRLEREAQVLAACREAGPIRWHDGGEYPSVHAAVQGELRALRAWGGAVAGEPQGRGARLRARRRAHEDAFRDILDETRSHFHGLVSYGAGFDVFQEVGFWDATDALVLTGYFGLRRVGERGDLVEAWRQHLERVQRAANATPRRRALPVYFSELGFTRRADSTVRPWSYEGFEALPAADGSSRCVAWHRMPLDNSERVRAIWALSHALDAGALPALRGFSLWKLTLQPEHRALEPYAIQLNGEADAPLRRALRGLVESIARSRQD